MERKITCIGCPLGCAVTVKTKGGDIKEISGHTCKRGEEYARTEVTDPRRTLTTTMRLAGGGLVPVKTSEPIKKALLPDAMDVIGKAEAKAPVEIGDVLIRSILGSGVDIVASDRRREV